MNERSIDDMERYIAALESTNSDMRKQVEHLNDELENEQARWQNRLDKLVEDGVDGAGCESGDPLDFTESELRQTMNIKDDRISKLEAEVAGIKEKLSRVRSFFTTNILCCGEPEYYHVKIDSTLDMVKYLDKAISTPTGSKLLAKVEAGGGKNAR